MNWRTSALIRIIVLFNAQALLAAGGSQAYLTVGQGTSAVDVKGIRHIPPSETAAPWMQDRIKAIAPGYPYADRARHHVGSGQFHLYLDLATGGVTQVTVTKSTGFVTLDQSALVALRQWRWRPGRWKEIDVPVTFTMQRNFVPAPGWVRLPQG